MFLPVTTYVTQIAGQGAYAHSEMIIKVLFPSLKKAMSLFAYIYCFLVSSSATTAKKEKVIL